MYLRSPRGTPILGIAGWKNSGKTTLTERLVAEFSQRGLSVATIKHAHHGFDIDKGETDSARHRRAGAQQVAIVSAKRWALMRELRDEKEPSLDRIVARLDPADLIIVEGYKTAPIQKIETRRTEAARQTLLCETDPFVIAVAGDNRVASLDVPQFALGDISAIADFIESALGLPGREHAKSIPAEPGAQDS